MSRNDDRVRSVAERIISNLAREDNGPRTAGGKPHAGEAVELEGALADLGKRLAYLESKIAQSATPDNIKAIQRGCNHAGEAASLDEGLAPSFKPQGPLMFTSNTYVPVAHPSNERFSIGEAVSELVDFFEQEKICSLEPGEKACDHCGLCSSRGF